MKKQWTLMDVMHATDEEFKEIMKELGYETDDGEKSEEDKKKEMTYDFVSEYYLAWTEGLTDTEIRETTKEDLIEWLTGKNSTVDEDVDVELLADRILSRIHEEDEEE